MSQDLVVKRCELTVRGRGGWGWGTDSERYVRAALPSIELALERIVAEAGLPDDADVRLTEPVSLRWRPDRTLDDAARHEVVAALRAAAAAARPDPVAGQATAPPQVPPGRGGPGAEPAAVELVVERLAGLLGAWSRSGRLPRLVAGWSEATVARWCEVLTSAEEGVGLAADAVEAVATAVLGQAARPGEPALGTAHRTLVVLGALVAAAGDRPVGPAVTHAAARLAGSPQESLATEPPIAATSTEQRAGDVRPVVHGEETSRTGSTPAGPALAPAVVQVPGLPFLVLVQLSRLGYLDALAAVAATSRDPGATRRLLVGAIAGKALPPPGRAWSRSPAETQAVEAAAGWPIHDQDAVSRALGDGSDGATLLAAPLASALVQLYAEPGTSDLEVTGTDHGWVVGEVAGSLPLAWVESPAEADRVLAGVGRRAPRSDRFEGLVDALWSRRAFPGVEQDELERVVGAVVGTALGSLALELWGRVDDAPLRALSRLSDLEVEVRPGSTAGRAELTIAVPRGQRWLDLVAAGLVDRWPMPGLTSELTSGTGSGTVWELVTW